MHRDPSPPSLQPFQPLCVTTWKESEHVIVGKQACYQEGVSTLPWEKKPKVVMLGVFYQLVDAGEWPPPVAWWPLTLDLCSELMQCREPWRETAWLKLCHVMHSALFPVAVILPRDEASHWLVKGWFAQRCRGMHPRPRALLHLSLLVTFFSFSSPPTSSLDVLLESDGFPTDVPQKTKLLRKCHILLQYCALHQFLYICVNFFYWYGWPLIYLLTYCFFEAMQIFITNYQPKI